MSNAIVLGSAGTPLDLAVAAWLDSKRRRSNSAETATAYEDTMSSFRAALAPHGLDLDGDPAAIATIAQVWAGEGVKGSVAPATYNKRVAIISSFYTFARKRGLLPLDNPMGRVERRTVQQYAQADALGPDEVGAALAAIDRTTLAGMRDYALLCVALITGRRLSEIAELRWASVRVVRADAVTLSFRAKGNKQMRDTLPRPIGQALLDYLKAFHGPRFGSLAADQPLWVSLSRQNYGEALHSNWLERIARARLGVHFHALRHTFARNMEDAGAKVSDIQARLGHESLATTGRYLAALRRADNPVADKLAAMFGLTPPADDAAE